MPTMYQRFARKATIIGYNKAILNDDVITRAFQAYGLAPVRLLGVQKGYRNESHPAELPDGRRVNLIIYKSEPDILQRIRAAHAVAAHLHRKGLPVRYTAASRIIRLQNGNRTRYGALYAYLPGATIPWEAYTMAHLKLTGRTMSNMHAALADMPIAGMPQVADEYAQILERMKRYFADPNVRQALRQKLSLTLNAAVLTHYLRLVRATAQLPGQQALHMDFVRGNILFSGNRETLAISGILDFEKAASGPPAFDIARTLAFLLVDCKYKTPQQVRKYFLYSGYRKRGAADFRDVRVQPYGSSLLEGLVQLFLVHDFYKFLRHNPYEFLEQNEHFMRTRQLLMEQNIIS